MSWRHLKSSADWPYQPFLQTNAAPVTQSGFSSSSRIPSNNEAAIYNGMYFGSSYQKTPRYYPQQQSNGNRIEIQNQFNNEASSHDVRTHFGNSYLKPPEYLFQQERNSNNRIEIPNQFNSKWNDLQFMRSTNDPNSRMDNSKQDRNNFDSTLTYIKREPSHYESQEPIVKTEPLEYGNQECIVKNEPDYRCQESIVKNEPYYRHQESIVKTELDNSYQGATTQSEQCYHSPQKSFSKNEVLNSRNTQKIGSVWSRLEPYNIICNNTANIISNNKVNIISNNKVNNIKKKNKVKNNSIKTDYNPSSNNSVTTNVKLVPFNDLRRKRIPQMNYFMPDIPIKNDEPPKIVLLVYTQKQRRKKSMRKDPLALCKQIIRKMNDMAQSRDIDEQPQLRFYNFTLISNTRIQVQCHDDTTVTWLLNFHPKPFIPFRSVLPSDLRIKVMIGVPSKQKDYTSSMIVSILSEQNPGLDVVAWRYKRVLLYTKGILFKFRVDGHTIRYLNKNYWKLQIGLDRVGVKFISSSSLLTGDYTPSINIIQKHQ